jgi:hypothetical protein
MKRKRIVRTAEVTIESEETSVVQRWIDLDGAPPSSSLRAEMERSSGVAGTRSNLSPPSSKRFEKRSRPDFQGEEG